MVFLLTCRLSHMSICVCVCRSVCLSVCVSVRIYGSLDFVRDNPGEPVPEETITHSHLSWSPILPVQLTCLTVFMHNLSPSFLWSTSWSRALHFILHTFLHPIIVFFSQHMPIPLQPALTENSHLFLVCLICLLGTLSFTFCCKIYRKRQIVLKTQHFFTKADS